MDDYQHGPLRRVRGKSAQLRVPARWGFLDPLLQGLDERLAPGSRVAVKGIPPCAEVGVLAVFGCLDSLAQAVQPALQDQHVLGERG